MSYATYTTTDGSTLTLAPEGSTVTPTGRVLSPEGGDMGEARLVLEVPRTPREQLREFVYDLVDGRVLTSEQVEPRDVGMVFMPLAMGALSPPAVLEDKPELTLPPQPAPPPPFVGEVPPERPEIPALAVVPEKVRLDYEWGAIDKADYDEVAEQVRKQNIRTVIEWKKAVLAPWQKGVRLTKKQNREGKEAYDKACEDYYTLKAAWAQECDRLRAEHEVYFVEWEGVRKRVLSLWARDLGVVYEHMSAAGPRAINGYPMFMSLRLMHREDWKLAFDAYKKEVARRTSNEDLFGESGI